jgi:hypothetical protein
MMNDYYKEIKKKWLQPYRGTVLEFPWRDGGQPHEPVSITDVLAEIRASRLLNTNLERHQKTKLLGQRARSEKMEL